MRMASGWKTIMAPWRYVELPLNFRWAFQFLKGVQTTKPPLWKIVISFSPFKKEKLSEQNTISFEYRSNSSHTRAERTAEKKPLSYLCELQTNALFTSTGGYGAIRHRFPLRYSLGNIIRSPHRHSKSAQAFSKRKIHQCASKGIWEVESTRLLKSL